MMSLVEHSGKQGVLKKVSCVSSKEAASSIVNNAGALRTFGDEDENVLTGLIGIVAREQAADYAATLLARWGDLGRVLTARPELLAQDVPVIVADLISAARGAVAQALARKIRNRPIIADFEALQEYLLLKIGYERAEHVRMLLLDTKKHLLADELLISGTIDEAVVYTREIVRRCLDLGATSLFLVHNHPSGSPEPSAGDRQLSARLSRVLRPLGICVDDHLIVATGGITSLRSLGLI